jgi:hypothetical protein
MDLKTRFIYVFAFLVYNHNFSVETFGQSAPLFDSEELLELTISGDVNRLLKDRKGKPEYDEMTLTYTGQNQEKISIPLRIRTRGNFRRQQNICTYPPILLNFSKKNVDNTVFEGQDKLKLVMPCKGDKYVVREYYAYKIYKILTPKSFNVRLVKLNLEDNGNKVKVIEPFYAFLIEDEDQMAERNGLESVGQDLIRPKQIDAQQFIKMALFQYFIANTDWSVQFRQNIKIIQNPETKEMVAVPYDFDFSGLVLTTYSKPAEELEMSSVRERRYRGYCITNMEHFQKAFVPFNELKDEIYQLYQNSPYLESSYIKSTLKYLDEFYQVINNPKLAERELQYPCLVDGTGDVVIKGLNKN